MIEVKNLKKAFGNLEVLKGISETIHEKEVVCVIGPSGSGKSTFIRCLNLLEDPTGGEVFLDGEKINDPKVDIDKIRERMGMVFQSFNLFPHKSVLENITLAPIKVKGMSVEDANKRGMELLETVGLSDKANAYPAQLSGGQKQRVAIARALALEPKVLLCDEATSALDPNTTASILELLKNINEKLGVTIIVITHEMSVIEKICHRVAVIDRSRIAEVGDVRDVFLNPSSAIAKQLILPRGEAVSHMDGKRIIRIVFDGKSSFEPVVSNMTLKCQTPVNILFADTKNIDGKAYGQMVLQLPDDEDSQRRIFAYLNDTNIKYTEEEFDV